MIGGENFLPTNTVLCSDIVHSLASSGTQVALGFGEQLKFHTSLSVVSTKKQHRPIRRFCTAKKYFVILRYRWLSQYPTQWLARPLAGHGRNVRSAQRAGHRHESFDRPSSSRLASSRQLR